MTHKILITRELPSIVKDKLTSAGHEFFQANFKKPPNKEQIIELLQKDSYDILITLLTDKIEGTAMDIAPNLKLIANYATGFDNINLEDAKARGIVVTNAPAIQSAEAVAEHTISLMLALARRLIPADNFTKAGKYDGWDPMLFIGSNFFGKTLGLVGTGQIGKRVAKYARALGLRVLYFDVKRDEAFEQELGVEYRASVEALLPEADFVSLHVPLLPSTQHLMNEAHFKIMKPTAYLINTSRGPVVDEVALEQAVRSSVIAGAALDVYEFEPKITDGLRSLENVILTPHIASASTEARLEMAEVMLRNIQAFINGELPPNVVSK
jgi:lactate dehydrogenase-like 2-hydroxyacid dehydrogenase